MGQAILSPAFIRQLGASPWPTGKGGFHTRYRRRLRIFVTRRLAGTLPREVQKLGWIDREAGSHLDVDSSFYISGGAGDLVACLPPLLPCSLALDQIQSSARFTSPAATGFHST